MTILKAVASGVYYIVVKKILYNDIVKRILYGALGIVCTVLGIIGVWVPGLPTTVFILIALWAFSKSSERMHAWLLKVPMLRVAIKEANRFQEEGTVDRRVKLVSQTCSWISFVGVAILTQNLIASVAVFVLAVSCSVFMWWVPTTQYAVSKSK